jgi:rsbT co-antagonist protein RsbR
MTKNASLHEIVSTGGQGMLGAWLTNLKGTLGDGRIADHEMQQQARDLLGLVTAALPGGLDTRGSHWDDARGFLAEISRSRALQGFSSSETATFVLSLKQPLFAAIREALADDAAALAATTWSASELVDRLALHTVEAYQKTREAVIIRQQEDLLELSTPVVKIWDGILVLPMIGTLDSARTQVVMESLLQRIVETSSEVAIIDITGVPTVDTLVAQHLLKAVTAIRLMGADCIISGIRPQIAQTIVHLGVDLRGVTTKASLADALGVAFQRSGLAVVKREG